MKSYWRTETSTNDVKTIVIFTPTGRYVHDSKSGKFNQVGDGQVSGLISIPIVFHFIGLEYKSLKLLNDEQIQGKITNVIETRQNIGQDELVQTFWISKEMGIPIQYRQQTFVNGKVLTILHEYTNFNFDPLPDDVFKVSDTINVE